MTSNGFAQRNCTTHCSSESQELAEGRPADELIHVPIKMLPAMSGLNPLKLCKLFMLPLDFLWLPPRRKCLKRQTVGLLLRYARLRHPQEPCNPPGRVAPDITGCMPHGNERLYGFGKLGSGIPEPPPGRV